MYKIQPFIWQKIDKDTTVFQTKSTTVVITNSKLSNFLIEIEKQHLLELDGNYIKTKFLEAEEDEVINFLLKNKLLKLEKKKQWKVSKIVLLSNDHKFEESFEYNVKNSYKVEVINLDLFRNMQFNDSDLLVVFLNPFNLKTMNDLTQKIKEKNVLVKFIFSYNNNIYFSNFYKKSWNNPCPMCFFYELESQLRGENSENSINFQTLIDILYEQEVQFSSHLPLSEMDYVHIICLLSKYLGEEIRNYYFDEILELELENYKVNKDTAYHWGYCDCYE